jgi:hypothetical protein
MIVFGLLSSVFDIIESTITELAVMLVLRTNRPLLPKPPRPAHTELSAPPVRIPMR